MRGRERGRIGEGATEGSNLTFEQFARRVFDDLDLEHRGLEPVPGLLVAHALDSLEMLELLALMADLGAPMSELEVPLYPTLGSLYQYLVESRVG